MDRIDILLSYLKKTDVLADVGCDHGYLSERALKAGLCKTVYYTDVSEKCLSKARKRLRTFTDEGKAIPVCTDGLTGVNADMNEICIAGLGGKETIGVLKECLNRLKPDVLLLQPMKNTPEVRAYLLTAGYFPETDETFAFGGKFYDVIVATPNKAGDTLSEDERLFGRDNLKNKGDAFTRKLKKEKSEIAGYLARENLSPASKEELIDRRTKINAALGEENEN